MESVRRSQWVAEVVENVAVCREHYRLVLKVDGFPPTDPGQFVQLSCSELETGSTGDLEITWSEGRPLEAGLSELNGRSAFLRRPFSLAGRRDRGKEVQLEFIQRVVGVGTDWLGRLRPGDAVGLIGPLGNRFILPDPSQTALLVGGGVGIPPMLYLGDALAGRRAIAFCGAQSSDLLPLTRQDREPSGDPAEPSLQLAEFARNGIPSVVSTDDGSYGYRGYVTQALEAYLNAHPGPAMLYTCGPEPMIKRVAEIAADRGMECQVAVERAMACGMGTCQSCCIRVRKPDASQPPLAGSEWCWRLACTDGPIFRGAELLW